MNVADILPEERLLIRLLMLNNSVSFMDTILHPAPEASETWRRFYTVYSAHDVHAGDKLHPERTYEQISNMEEAERTLWSMRTFKSIHIDSSAHNAYATLDNGLDQPDIMISLLGWSRWGMMLLNDNSTLALVG